MSGQGLVDTQRSCLECGLALPVPHPHNMLRHKRCQERHRNQTWYRRHGGEEKQRARSVARWQAAKAGDHVRLRAYGVTARKKLRLEVLAAYGNVCACCGEGRIEFMTIDHINGDGAAHRREKGVGRNGLYSWLKRNQWPSGFRVLCWNCNESLGHYGYCPHTRDREK